MGTDISASYTHTHARTDDNLCSRTKVTCISLFLRTSYLYTFFSDKMLRHASKRALRHASVSGTKATSLTPMMSAHVVGQHGPAVAQPSAKCNARRSKHEEAKSRDPRCQHEWDKPFHASPLPLDAAGGLLEYSVVYTDRSMNHMSKPFCDIMKNLNESLKEAFLYKLAFEQAVTVAAGTMYEVAHRGDKLKKEWDLAASNVAQMCVANLATVWLCTPSRSFGGVQKFGWQKALAGMPNNAFDRAGPLRPYTTGTRIASVVAKGAELSAVGVVIGGAFSGLNNLLVNSHKKKEGKKWKPAVPVPDVKTSALGMGAFLGLSCNARYQLIGGADRWMTDRLTSLGSAITATALMRLTNNQVGEQTRLFLLGLPLHAQRQRVRGTTGYTRASSKKSAGGVRKTKKVKRKVKRKVPAAAVAADATVAPPATPAVA